MFKEFIMKYHVKEDGSYGKCEANKKKCPIGVFHSTDMEEIMYESEKIFKDKNDAFNTKKAFNYKKMTVIVNENFSFPNVSNFNDIPNILEKIKDGTNTHDDFAKSKNVVERQGRYYGNAIGYLNLANYYTEGNTYHYYLTETGEELLKLPKEKQKKMLDAIVNNLPVIQKYRESGEEAVVDYLVQTHGYKKSMAESRMPIIKRWENLVEDKSLLLESKQEFITGDETKNPTKKHNVVSNEVCMECFTTKALDGSCMC